MQSGLFRHLLSLDGQLPDVLLNAFVDYEM